MKGQETRGFQSEVKQLLQMMIHSLYSNKDIFLRELISNASDAADKLRFQALSQPHLYEDDGELRVRISCDKENRTITINDNGIGMSREEVIDNLGTIAKSGTKAFLSSMKFDKSKEDDNPLIGQFGVGFYSAFIVADKVVVRTRSAGHRIDDGVYWESDGKGNYTIADIEKPTRGTEITLHIRDEEKEFLNDWRLRSLISKYSDHIALSVEMETRTEGQDENHGQEIIRWEKVNKAQALWKRNKSDISDEEYQEFYKHLSHNLNEPLTWIHNHVEGIQTYTSLLYIPDKMPWNMWDRNHKHGLKLYVQRVFVMDDAEQFIARYLRFIQGVIDSNDLPLNVSRDILQDSHMTQNLKKALTKRALLMLEKLAKDTPEKYQVFWEQFGLILKEGPAEDAINVKIIAKLLRFASTYNSDSAEQNVSLEDYISRMQKQQEKIYYITSDSYASAKNSPNLEFFRKKDIEVLLLSDRIDEWMMSYLSEYNGKSFQSVNRFDPALDKLAKQSEKQQQTKDDEKKMELFIKRVEKYLGDRVKEVRLTYRLIETPAIVIADTDGITTQMAKLFASAGQQQTKEIRYIFEVNPNHEFVKHTANLSDDQSFGEWIEFLLDQALLAECGTLNDPHKFIRRVNKLISMRQ